MSTADKAPKIDPNNKEVLALIAAAVAAAITEFKNTELPGLLISAGNSAVSKYETEVLPGKLSNAASAAVSKYVSETLPGELQAAREFAVKNYVLEHPVVDLIHIETEADEALPLEDALQLVERVVIYAPKEKGDEPTSKTFPITEDEVLAYKDLGDKVVVVTKDGQKFYGDKA